MNDTTIDTERDAKTGRFLAGNSGNGGRQRGSRNKLGERFLEDLACAWQERGAEALRRCAEEEPAQFVRVVAGLMPREAELAVNIDLFKGAANVLEAFRLASDLLGVNPRAALKRLQRVDPNVFKG